MKSSFPCQAFTASGNSSGLADPMPFLLADSFQFSLERINSDDPEADNLTT
jgi:site-specific DNA-cytosine methylase